MRPSRLQRPRHLVAILPPAFSLSSGGAHLSWISCAGPWRLSSGPPTVRLRWPAFGFLLGRLCPPCRIAAFLSSAGALPTSLTSVHLFRIEPWFTSPHTLLRLSDAIRCRVCCNCRDGAPDGLLSRKNLLPGKNRTVDKKQRGRNHHRRRKPSRYSQMRR